MGCAHHAATFGSAEITAHSIGGHSPPYETESEQNFAVSLFKRARRMKWMILAGALVAILGVGWFAGRSAVRSFFYPPAPSMPPTVSQSIDDVLRRLEDSLQLHAPAVAEALHPGLSDEQIAEIERTSGFRLNDELRSLYRWHNGIAGQVDFIPGHRFLPLDEVAAQNAAMRQQLREATILQRAVFGVVIGHRVNWVNIFEDGFGDGYFYDPARNDSQGAFFYCLAEDRHYLFFPSVRNFLVGVAKCYQAGIYSPAEKNGFLDEDYSRSHELWQEFGAFAQ